MKTEKMLALFVIGCGFVVALSIVWKNHELALMGVVR